MPYLPEETIVTKKKNNQRSRKNKVRQSLEESVNMINTLRSEYNHLLASPFFAKKDDPGTHDRVYHWTEYSTRPFVTLGRVLT